MKDNVTQLILGLSIFLIYVTPNDCTRTISCFVCDSTNQSDPGCEDPFSAGITAYVEKCMVPKRGYKSLFPAHFCIKVTGTSYTTNEKIVIRRCTTETMDTQCGKFRFENDTLKGCILTCDQDGCNEARVNCVPQYPILIIFISFLVVFISPSCFHWDGGRN